MGCLRGAVYLVVAAAESIRMSIIMCIVGATLGSGGRWNLEQKRNGFDWLLWRKKDWMLRWGVEGWKGDDWLLRRDVIWGKVKCFEWLLRSK